MTDVLAAEWLKVRSVQSTFYVLAAVVGMVPVGGLIAWNWAQHWDGLSTAERAHLSGSSIEQAVIPFVQLCLAVLGTLAVTAEYATGMIRTTLTAVPQRGALVAAKAVVVGGVSLVAGLFVVVLTHLVSRAVIGDRPFPGYAGTVTDEIRGLLSLALSVPVVTLVAFGLGVVTRSTAGALSIVFAVLFVLPPLTYFIPEPWDNRLFSVMLASLPDQLAGVRLNSSFQGVLPPAAAAAVMLAYAVASVGAAVLVVSRRDA